jgi:hypothetical protein
VAVARRALALDGQASHAGTTPMAARRDAGAAAAEVTLVARRIASQHDGLATVASLSRHPGIPTVVAGRAELVETRQPSLFHDFPSKAAIAEALLEHSLARVAGPVQALASGTGSAAARLYGYVYFDTRYLATAPYNLAGAPTS